MFETPSQIRHLQRTGINAVCYEGGYATHRSDVNKALKKERVYERWCEEDGLYDYDDCNAGDACYECECYDHENHECKC